MTIMLLILGGVLFASYAVFSHFSSTPTTDSVPKRVWASVVAAGAAVGAAVMSWIHNATGP